MVSALSSFFVALSHSSSITFRCCVHMSCLLERKDNSSWWDSGRLFSLLSCCGKLAFFSIHGQRPQQRRSFWGYGASSTKRKEKLRRYKSFKRETWGGLLGLSLRSASCSQDLASRKKRDNGQVLPAVTNDFLFHLPTNLKEQMNCGETGSGIVTVNSFFGELTVMCLTANQRPDVFSLLTGRYKLKTLRLSPSSTIT